MAGFYSTNTKYSNQYRLEKRSQGNLSKISRSGLKWNNNLIKNSVAIGVNEEGGNQYNTIIDLYNNPEGVTNFSGSNFIAFYDKEYTQRREFLRKFSMNGEIEYVLDTISDECVIYDNNNRFMNINSSNLVKKLDADKKEEIKEALTDCFDTVYERFGFHNSNDAWNYLRKFLIDGFLAFEIIFDTDKSGNATEIIGFKEIDPATLVPKVRINAQGEEERFWIQNEGDNDVQRELDDASVIYISWAKGNFASRLSYVERLVRTFNMMRTMENSRIIWYLQNAQKRIKFIIPVGSSSEQKARMRINELKAQYKEDVNINAESGEVTVNGQPNFSFAKNIFIPQTSTGGAIDINEITHSGYDFKSTDDLKYFWQRFVLETKVPSSRLSFGSDNSKIVELIQGSSLTHEEISFGNYINRIRTLFREIISKPVWIQFCLKYPMFKNDELVRSNIAYSYIENNLLIKAKEGLIAKSLSDVIGTLSGIKIPTVINGVKEEINYFDIDFLINKFLDFSEEDIETNKSLREAKLKEQANAIKKNEKENKENVNESGPKNEFGEGGPTNFDNMFNESPELESPEPEVEEAPLETPIPENNI